jgi:hypothetical protein
MSDFAGVRDSFDIESEVCDGIYALIAAYDKKKKKLGVLSFVSTNGSIVIHNHIFL